MAAVDIRAVWRLAKSLTRSGTGCFTL